MRRVCRAALLIHGSMMRRSLMLTSRILGAAWQRLEAGVSLALTLLRRRASLRATRLRRLVTRNVDADDSGVGTDAVNNARHLIELRRLEFLDDVLQLALLNQCRELVEALSARLDLLDLVLRAVQVGQDES